MERYIAIVDWRADLVQMSSFSLTDRIPVPNFTVDNNRDRFARAKPERPEERTRNR